VLTADMHLHTIPGSFNGISVNSSYWVPSMVLVSLRSDLYASDDPNAFYSVSSVIFSLTKLRFVDFDDDSFASDRCVS
jgi:hypothetical protein